MRSVVKRRFLDLYSFLVGMRITVKHLFKPPITLQYPVEHWTMPERSRGRLFLPTDEMTGALKCNACKLCAMVCPVACINIKSAASEDKKRYPEVFDIDFGLCMFCGLCVEQCPRDAIIWVGDYEFCTNRREDLVWNKEALSKPWQDSHRGRVRMVQSLRI